jgi:acyl-CoA synthetase (AMP-forming)/AMP-acid ligase II
VSLSSASRGTQRNDEGVPESAGCHEATIRDGWFSTGDIARVDDDGYYHIVDGKKDLIVQGGKNVYPREVEGALNEHPCGRR